MTKIKTVVRNPHKDGAPARDEHAIAIKRLTKYFGKVERVGRKQMYITKGPNPFYILVVSAPSNLKFDAAIKTTIREHGNYPMYVLFTRDVNTYPTMGQTYWDKIKAVYKKAGRSFRGAIMGLNEFNEDMASQMKANAKIKLDYIRYIDITGGNVTIQQVLKELAGLTPKKLKVVLPILQLLK